MRLTAEDAGRWERAREKAERRRLMAGLTDNTDIHVCLCCGQRVEVEGKPITPEGAERSFRVLSGLGFTKESLLTKHRAQIDWQSPGFSDWLEAKG